MRVVDAEYLQIVRHPDAEVFADREHVRRLAVFVHQHAARMRKLPEPFLRFAVAQLPVVVVIRHHARDALRERRLRPQTLLNPSAERVAPDRARDALAADV